MLTGRGFFRGDEATLSFVGMGQNHRPIEGQFADVPRTDYAVFNLFWRIFAKKG